jgi:two-component system response regulator YesN
MSAPVLEAVRYIRHHFREDIALDDLARHIDMSPSWLTKRFNRECGMSIPQYLLSVRMERAQRLFLETNMLVFEVANAVAIAVFE